MGGRSLSDDRHTMCPAPERLFADSVPLHQCELPDLGHPALEEVRAAHQVAHGRSYTCGGVGDRSVGAPPPAAAPRCSGCGRWWRQAVQARWKSLRDRRIRIRRRRTAPHRREDLLAMNRMNFRSVIVIGMPISGQRLSGWPMMVCNNIRPSGGVIRWHIWKNALVALLRERLRTPRWRGIWSTGSSNSPNRATGSARAVGVHLVEQLLAQRALVAAERQADDVDVVLLDGSAHRRTPAAADVEQRHPRPQIELGQREVDLASCASQPASARSKNAQL